MQFFYRSCLARWLHAVALLAALSSVGAAVAATDEAQVVYTRADVRETFEEDHGKRFYIRLKLLPRGKLPFTTITYRVLDRQLVAGLRPGDSVAFRAERIDGENMLVAIQRAPPCERFKECR